MCHREATAVKDYRMADREKSSLAAARHLSVAMRSTTEKSAINLPSANDTNTAPVEIETIKSSRMEWNPTIQSKVFTCFDSELRNNDINLHQVKQKLKFHPDLAEMDPRKVYDKLRRKVSELNGLQTPVEPPTERETVSERVDRFLDNMSDCDLQTSSSIIGPSTTASKSEIFSKENAACLAKMCSSIIISGPIGEVRTTELLNTSTTGQQFLKQFTISQIISRLKYERRKCKGALSKPE